MNEISSLNNGVQENQKGH